MMKKLCTPEEMKELTYKTLTLDYWSDHINISFNIAKLVFSQNEREIRNCLVFLRFQEIQKLIRLLPDILCIGAYYSVLRELRYLLESMLQAHYVESNYAYIPFEGKLAVLKEREKLNKAIGQSIINALALEENVKSKVTQLYRELSDYVHPTPRHLEGIMDDMKKYGARFVPSYFDEDLLRTCGKFLDRVLDIAYYIFFKNYPERKAEFCTFRNELKRRNCQISLDYISQK